MIYGIKCLLKVNKHATSKLTRIKCIPYNFSYIYQCMICRIVFSKSKLSQTHDTHLSVTQTHDTHLNRILDRLMEMGVTLNKEKCEWSQKQVLWFGYNFSQAGMAPDPNKVKAIQKLSPPTSTAEVKSFLQMCQCNAMFMLTDIATYSDVTAPLRMLTRKDVKFE